MTAPASAGGRAPLTNWAGNVAFRAERVHRPRRLPELQRIVAGATRVRALGSGHSFNRMADTPHDLVTVRDLPRELEVDTAARRVRVSAGTRYGEMVGPLHEAGFALHNLGSLPHISIAGACATGTHGSGARNGTLASAVAALELVTADGSLLRLSRDDDPDRFDGCVVALGTLGVVTSLELDVEPTYDVRQHVYEGLPLETLYARFDEITAADYSISMFSDWRSRELAQVWRRERVEQGTPDVAPEQWLGARLADGPRHPVPGMSGSVCTEQLGVVGPWHARLACFRLEFTPSNGAELQSEWFVGHDDAVPALQALEVERERIAPVLQIAEVRTIAQDRLWLSPSADRPTVALHFTWIDDEAAVAPVVAAIEDRLSDFAARPHWGKVFSISPDLLRQRYAHYDDAEALMRELDPSGTFRNELVDAYFPGARPS